MPADVMNAWLDSGKFAQIEDISVKPKYHPTIAHTPLSVQKGQAETYFLEADDSKRWILKKFYPNKCPDTPYLKTISSILPSHNAFRCGTERKIFTDTSLKKVSGFYHSKIFDRWLKDTVLMPQIEGIDWVCLAEQIRKNEVNLSEIQRISLCKGLVEIVKMLESKSLSHRDISNGNIFIDPRTLSVSLIDFDSVYNPDLVMPSATTVGSEGYTAAFIDRDDVNSTYCSQADRFALTVLCIEFLILTSESPFNHEGGIFDQDEILKRSGSSINYAKKQLQKFHPQPAKFFDKAIKSRSFQDCPSPDEWLSFCKQSGEFISVNDLPEVVLKLPEIRPVTNITILENAWKNKKGKSKNGVYPQFNFLDLSPVTVSKRPYHHLDYLNDPLLPAKKGILKDIAKYFSPKLNC